MYIVLACQRGQESTESIFSVLKSRVSGVCDEVCKFEVPDTLKFGTFDSLIKLMDDLTKYDAQVEGVFRKIERQILELDSQAEFKVAIHNKIIDIEAYIRSFQWDDTKFPSNRSVGDNLLQLWQAVSRIDEDIKHKSYAFADVKTNMQALQKAKAGISFTVADLTEVLTPENVANDDFINKEHLTTVVVVVANGQEDEWVKSYEMMNSKIVPRSTKKFQKIENGAAVPLVDKDGNTLWRCILFRSEVESFKKDAKDKKFMVREFDYSRENYQEKMEKSKGTKDEYEKKLKQLKTACGWAFSDTLVAWMHLKGMRVFVESILRYGVPPNFSSFIVKPTGKNWTKLRTLLNDVFSSKGLFGQSYIGDQKGKEDDGDEYYPYVSLSFSARAEMKAN